MSSEGHHSRRPKAFDKLEKNFKKLDHGLHQRVEGMQQDVKNVFRRRKKNKDKDQTEYESIERVKVYSLAAKARTKQSTSMQLKRSEATYWMMATVIGFFVGLAAYISHEGLAGIQGFRIWLSRLFMQWFTGPAGIFFGWATYCLSSVAVVLVGALLCIYVQPIARGGGIAEIKAFLNGVNIPQLFQLRTLFIKLIAVICAVGGGLCVGQEGPMIHIGACVAWNMSQMKFSKIPKVSRAFRKFQNDKDKRDFVTSGASMGVSAAFSAPIGGTLFGLEEASSFWSHALIWRSFWGCMVATWIANFLINGSKLGFGQSLDQPSHVMYRVPFGHGYRLYEILPFLLVGIIGGALGALFIKLNVTINKWRKKTYYTNNRNKVIELVVLAVITSSLSILLPMAFGCQDSSLAKGAADSSETANVNQEAEEALVFEIYNCGVGQYNQLASLWFTSSEMTLKHLFVRSAPQALSGGVLTTFFVLYYLLSCFTAGSWIAAGLLVPMLIMGASYGRLFGVVLDAIFPAAQLDPGQYALLGATAFMGGVTRMTLSLVVIMLEITNDLDALLPIMLVAMVAKWVGDGFIHSLYDMQIHMGNIPFLEWDAPKLAHIMISREAVTSNIPMLEEVETVENILNVIKDDTLNTIPVIDRGLDRRQLILKGSIPKLHLKLLLSNRAFEQTDLVDVVSVKKVRVEPKFNFTQEELQKTLDLKPYINMATFVVQDTFPLHLTYKIFRNQGLRVLFVVDYKNNLLGAIERDNLLLEGVKHSHGHEQKSLMQTSKEDEHMIELEGPINGSHIIRVDTDPNIQDDEIQVEDSQTEELVHDHHNISLDDVDEEINLN